MLGIKLIRGGQHSKPEKLPSRVSYCAKVSYEQKVTGKPPN
jgi:hypothetical protein